MLRMARQRGPGAVIGQPEGRQDPQRAGLVRYFGAASGYSGEVKGSPCGLARPWLAVLLDEC